MFGDKALIYQSPRFRTARAKTPCEFWAINRTAYKEALIEV